MECIFLNLKLKSTGSDMYDENIHYPRLVILSKTSWRSVVIAVNNANLWYYEFQILTANSKQVRRGIFLSFYHWNKIYFVELLSWIL